jgi:hypothetical protein
MHTMSSFVRVLFVNLLVAGFATSAHAGFWLAVYDLAPGSNTVTSAPGGPFTDPITGSLSVFYDAASSGAPLTGAHLMKGQINGSLSQPAGVLTVTGTTMNLLLPGPGGTPGTLSGASLSFSVVTDHTVSGFLHCADLTGAGGFCDIFFGTPSSTPMPQTGSGTFPLPRFDFAATGGVGDFTSTSSVQTPISGVTVTTTYVGREVRREWYVPEPTGISMLVPGVLLLFGLRARWRPSAR